MAGIFKAYDVRGIYPTELDETLARKIGQAFRNVLDEEDLANSNSVVVSRDMRPSSVPLAQAMRANRVLSVSRGSAAGSR